MVDNITTVIKEYKEMRGLEPIRVCVLGAPAVGKTFIIRQLCHHYKLHHVKIADTIKEAIDDHVSARLGMQFNLLFLHYILGTYSCSC